MKKYEVLTIFKPILDVDSVDTILEKFKKDMIEHHGGEIVNVDCIGRKRLAYEIRKFKDAFMAIFIINFAPEKVADFRRACQHNDDLLRVVVVNYNEEAAAATAAAAARRKERNAQEPAGSARN